MNRLNRLTTLGGMLVVAASLSCTEAARSVAPNQAAVPAPGRLVVTLQGAGAGAVLLELRGRGIEAPQATDSTWELLTGTVDSTGSVYRIAVMGKQLDGA